MYLSTTWFCFTVGWKAWRLHRLITTKMFRDIEDSPVAISHEMYLELAKRLTHEYQEFDKLRTGYQAHVRKFKGWRIASEFGFRMLSQLTDDIEEYAEIYALAASPEVAEWLREKIEVIEKADA